MGQEGKETLTFLDDDIARFMEEGLARRGVPEPTGAGSSGHYEDAFRVIGRYLDEQRPHDVFFFEQGGAFVVRILLATQTGKHHELAEFTREDIDRLVAAGPTLRARAASGLEGRPPASAACSASGRTCSWSAADSRALPRLARQRCAAGRWSCWRRATGSAGARGAPSGERADRKERAPPQGGD